MPTLEELEQKYFVSDPSGPNRVYRGGASDVEALVDGKAYLPEVFDAITRTQGPGDAVYISGWVLTDSAFRLTPTAPPLLDLLVEKADKHVDVRVILWSIAHLRPFRSAEVVKRGLKNELNVTMTAAIRLRRHNPQGYAWPLLDDRVLLDWSAPGYGAHHQKSIVVVAPRAPASNDKDVLGFLAGMDLVPYVEATPGHADQPFHDAGLLVRGRAAMAVLDNFRTRWKMAASLPRNEDTWFTVDGDWLPTPFPRIPKTLPSLPQRPAPGPDLTNPSAQHTSVQIVQTFAKNEDPWMPAAFRPGRADVHATLERALGAARNYVYIEDQYFGLAEGIERVKRDVVTAMLTDALQARPSLKVILMASGGTTWDHVDSELKGSVFNNRLAVWKVDGAKSRHSADTPHKIYTIKPIFVHSKIVLIDDEFAMIGSANFADRSLIVDNGRGTDSELSAAIVTNDTWVRNLRVKLWTEHLTPLAIDPARRSDLEDPEMALGLWRTPWVRTPRTLETAADLVARLPPAVVYEDPGTPRVLLRYVGPGDAP